MKITTKIDSDGVKREIDFGNATLPDGRLIQEVLDENESLKRKVIILDSEMKKSASILTILIPNRTTRIIIEAVLILMTLWGVMALF